MNIKTHHTSKNKNNYRLAIIVALIMLGLFIFTFFNTSFNQMPIGKITHIETSHGQKITDEHHNTDTKYSQRLTIRILNGKYKGDTTNINNHFVKSQADSEQFSKNEKVLLHMQKGPSDATILEKKRDSLTVAIVEVFIVTLLIVGKNVGLQSILSLIFNTAFIIAAIAIHNTFSGTNLFLLMSMAIIISTNLTLKLLTGGQ